MVKHVGTTRSVHALTGVATCGVAAAAMLCWPELGAGAVAAAGSAGVVISAYGVVFTMVELSRTRSAAVLAASEARKAHAAVGAIVTITEITTCRARIDVALEAVRQRSAIPTPLLRQIAEVYIKVFRKHTHVADSEYRRNKDLLESFAYSGRGDEQACQRLWNCLSRVSGHFAELEADTRRFTELHQ